jgi:hypothetical protein
MSDKIIRYPFRVEAAKRENRKKRRVPCEVSERWLQFSQINHYQDADYIYVDVMTSGADGSGRKICQLIVTKEDLMSVLADLPIKDWTSK